MTCGCAFNLADNGDGTHRFLTREEAVILHQQEYDAEPWRVRLFQLVTGDTTEHRGTPEDDPQIAALLAAGWVNLHDIYPDFPRRFKNVLDPATNPQPYPKLCPAHQALGHTKGRFDAAMHESHRLDVAAAIYADRRSITALQNYDFLNWSFDAATVPNMPGARVLRVAPAGSAQDKAFLFGAFGLEFGPGQIVVA